MPEITIITGDGVKNEINVNDVQTYLDELPPENIKIINVSNCELTILSNLARFTNLWKLLCSFNKLTTLPELPKNLRKLDCGDNQLTTLPELPKNLRKLDCSNNQISSLPTLPEGLIWLDCYNNQISSLPKLPNSLNGLDYINNPIFYIIEDIEDLIDYDIDIPFRTITKLNRFRHLYYCLRFKLKFIQWFLRANERKIMEQNHPDKITALLASGLDVLDL